MNDEARSASSCMRSNLDLSHCGKDGVHLALEARLATATHDQRSLLLASASKPLPMDSVDSKVFIKLVMIVI